MGFLRQNGNTILICILEALVGVFLLMDPVRFAAAIVIALGIALLLAGIGAVVRYFRTNPVEAAMGKSLAKGLALLLAGAFCALRPGWIVTAFPFFTVLYGVLILLVGLSKIQWSVDSLRMHTGRWFLPAISAAVSVVCALVIFANPFSTTVILWMFTGVTLIVEAVLDVVAIIFMGKGSTAEKKEEKEESTDA